MQTGYELIRHLVPLNGSPVFGANPTLPFVVRPSSHLGPSVEPRHSRFTKSGPISMTFHLVPVNGAVLAGARPTVVSPVLPSSHLEPSIRPRHCNPIVPSGLAKTVHLVPVRLLMHILSTNPTVPSCVRPSKNRTPGISPKHSRATSRRSERMSAQLAEGRNSPKEPPARNRNSCLRFTYSSSCTKPMVSRIVCVWIRTQCELDHTPAKHSG